jgi:quercetin 2,3-dioxygenase
MKRRVLLKIFATLSFLGLGSFGYFFKRTAGETMIESQFPIDFQWPVLEPFLFCVHHLDHYPAGNNNNGVDAKEFSGRQMGQDFQEKNGFRLYHGREIPGFPVHPHRGFETITIVRQGLVDHADSLGAAGRYGEGDVQWMTAGSGVQHSEMFPLLHKDKKNTLELFQIWLNLPRKSKMTTPQFKMLWADTIPQIVEDNGNVTIELINGKFKDQSFLQAPPDSWAADENNEVNIFIVKLKNDATFEFSKAKSQTNRVLYFFKGQEIIINGEKIQPKRGIVLNSSEDLKVRSQDAQFLLLEAKPIGEPTVQHGPFVMNSKEEIIQTIQDYQKTQFGGWPWPQQDMIHGSKIEKFAKYPNGRIETRNS